MSAIKAFWSDERIRFLAIGGVNTGVGYGLFALFQLTLGNVITYVGSLIFSHLIASVCAFIFYRRIVFKVTGNGWVDFGKFQLVYVASFTANLIILPILVSVLTWNPYFAQAFTIAVIAITSYFGHKFFSFRRPSENLGTLSESRPEHP